VRGCRHVLRSAAQRQQRHARELRESPRDVSIPLAIDQRRAHCAQQHALRVVEAPRRFFRCALRVGVERTLVNRHFLPPFLGYVTVDRTVYGDAGYVNRAS
jgi:hypothetical protein